jgi:multiple sugar transport system permease protein
MAIALVMHRAIFGRGVVRTSVLIPYGIITVVAAFAWQFAFAPDTGFVNHLPLIADDMDWFGGRFSSFAVIILAEVWKTTPFMALLLLAGLVTIDGGLYEAAKVDGASAWQRFTRITLPLMKPAILVALLFRTLDAFRVFDTIFVMTRGAQDTESVSILGYNQLISRLNLGLGSAVSVLIFICVFLIAFLFVKGFGTKLDYASWTVAIVLVLVFALIPVIWLISLSLKPPEAVTDGRFIPSEVSFDNYKSLFEGGISDSPFIKPLINSIGIALITTVISIVLASFAAYAIARLEFPGKRVILAGALAIAMFPPISTVGPLFDMWRALGLYDTWPGLIIPYLTFSLPLAIYVLVAFFREIPWDLEQAAQVDGATPFQAFTKVIVPLAAPGVFTAAILVFIFAWNDFLFAISLTSSDASRTVPAALAFFTGESSFTQPTGSIAAAAVVVTVPIIVFVLFFQRRIVSGLTAGAVKG